MLVNLAQQKAEAAAVVETKADGMSTGLFQDEEEEYNLEEDTKYKLKLDAPQSEPAFGGSGGDSLDSFDDAGDDFGGEDLGGDFGEEGNDKPFDDEPFEAGVEADEDTDPEKYIQQLTGKLGTSLRKYNDERGEPDFDLEKYAINSVISASHTSEMDEEDQKDIIRKIKTSGAESDVDDSAEGLGTEPEGEEDPFADEELEESAAGDVGNELPEETRIIDIIKGLRNNNMELTVDNIMVASLFKAGGTVTDENLIKAVLQIYQDEINNGNLHEEDTMTINLRNMKQDAEDMLSMDVEAREKKLKGHKWADDHISTSADDAEEVSDFLTNEGKSCWDGYERVPGTKQGAKGSCRKKTNESLMESEYQGKKVELNKPSSGDVKKYKVYVKNDKGNVVKVNFGDKNMEIRRDNPEAKKSFRARHDCANKKDKTTAGYWSCKMWSNEKVSDIVGEGLQESEKNSKFVESKSMKDIILNKLHETTEPIVKPAKPEVKPVSPRRKRIWETKPSVKPKPKMEENSGDIFDEIAIELGMTTQGFDMALNDSGAELDQIERIYMADTLTGPEKLSYIRDLISIR